MPEHLESLRLPYLLYFLVLILVVSRAAAGAAAYHEQQVVRNLLRGVFPFPFRVRLAQLLDIGCPIISGVAAAAIFDAYFHASLPRVSVFIEKSYYSFCVFARFLSKHKNSLSFALENFCVDLCYLCSKCQISPTSPAAIGIQIAESITIAIWRNSVDLHISVIL